MITPYPLYLTLHLAHFVTFGYNLQIGSNVNYTRCCAGKCYRYARAFKTNTLNKIVTQSSRMNMIAGMYEYSQYTIYKYRFGAKCCSIRTSL